MGFAFAQAVLFICDQMNTCHFESIFFSNNLCILRFILSHILEDIYYLRKLT